jgi:hypothetical protein
MGIRIAVRPTTKRRCCVSMDRLLKTMRTRRIDWRNHLRIRKRFLLTLSVVLVGLILLYWPGGLVSNAFTKRACERHTAGAIVRALQARESMPPFIYAPSAHAPRSVSAFESVGVTVRQCDDPSGGCFPSMVIGDAEPIGPYVMSVSWTVVLFPLGANSGTSRCLSIFGLTFCKLDIPPIPTVN